MKQRAHHLLKATLLTVATSFLITCSSDKPTENTNHPPAAPANDAPLGSPSHSSTSISRTPTLHWSCADPDRDALKYDVYFGDTATPPVVSTRQTETSYSPDTLDYATEYYWRVVAVDGDGASASSATWNFTTVVQPSETVSTPTTPSGPGSGYTSENLSYSTGGATSSFGHSVQYRFVWSVGDTSNWAASTTGMHSWASAGIYAVGAQARCAADTGVVSNWSSAFAVTIIDPPACSIQPATLDFGEVEVGASKDLSFTITNIGGGVLSGSVTESCSDFTIVSGGGAYNLTAGQSITVTVRFDPTTEGARACTIETGAICSNDVSCTATGYQLPVCSLSTNSLDFGIVTVGESSPASFTITNTGGGTLSFFVPYSCYFDFDITSGGGQRSLTAGQSLTVQIRFQPQSSGAKTCTFDIGSAYCGDITLTGYAVNPPYCVVANTYLNFGAIRLGGCSYEQGFSIQNQGGGTVTGDVSASCPQAFEITSGAGPFSLQAGAIMYVHVRYCPRTVYIPETCTIDLGTSCGVDVTCTGRGSL